MSDDIINLYKKAQDPEQPQKPILEQEEAPVPVMPEPDEPFDKFLVELAEKLKNEKKITPQQQEAFVEQVQQPIEENTDNTFQKFLGDFANTLKQDKLVNREENIKEATISFINKLKEQPEKPFIIPDEKLPVKNKKKDYLPQKFAKKLPEPVEEEPVEREFIEPVKTTEVKKDNKYVKELASGDKTNRKVIPEKDKKVSDIETVVTEQFNKLKQMYPNLMPHGGGGGGTNAVQYAKGGTMDGNLNVTGKFLSAGVPLQDIFLTSQTDSQTLTFDENTKDLSISNGNTVSLSSLVDIETTFSENSAKYESTFTTVQNNSATTWNYQGTDLKELSSNWQSTYETYSILSADYAFKAEIIPTVTDYLSSEQVTVSSLNVTEQLLSAGTDLFDIFLTSETDSQTLNFTESSAELSISNGNTVSLSSLIDYETAFSENSAKYEGVYTTVQTNSGSWDYQGTDLKELSSNWQQAYTNLVTNSAAYLTSVDLTFLQEPSANWNTAYNIATTYSTASSTFATNTELESVSSLLTPLTLTNTLTGQLVANTKFSSYQTDVANTTAALLPTSIYQNASGNWQSTYTTVQNNSATAWNYQGTDLKQLTAKYEDTSTVVQTKSGDWDTGYLIGTFYQTTSGDFATNTTVNTLTSQLLLTSIYENASGNWQDTFTTVQNNSGNWDYQGTDLKELSSNWQSTYETVSALSAQWSQDIQTLSFDEGTQVLSIENGNTVSLSSLAVSSINIPTVLEYLATNNIDLSGVTLTPATNLSNFNTERVLQDKLTEVISVKDFGAKGDGVANDWLPIQRALSAAAGFAKLFVPPGLYMITQELKMLSNTYVYGAGIGTTVIKLSAGATASQNVLTNVQNTRSYLTNQGNENIVVKDLELDGNAQRFPGSYSITGSTAGCGLGLARVVNATVERVYVKDCCNHGLDVAAGQNTIDGNPLTYTPGPSQNIYLKDIIASGAGDDNITFHFSKNITLDGFYTFDTSKRRVSTNSNGIEVDDGCFDVVIKNGYAKGCSRGVEIKGHDFAPASQRVTVYNVTVEGCVRNFDIRHIGFETPDSATAFDVSLYNCTSISPLSSTELASTATRALKISSYDGVYVKDFSVVGIHDSTNAVTVQENAKNVVIDGMSFVDITGNNLGITEALLKIDNTANRNVTLKNIKIRNCPGTAIYAIGSVPGVVIDGVDAWTTLAPAPNRAIHFTYSPVATPYTIKNVTVTGYTNAYRLGGSHNFDYPVPVDVGLVRNILPSSPASANTQYIAAQFGWREGTAQALNAGVGARLEFTGNIVSGVSANNDIPIAFISTEKINSTDTDLSSRLNFGTRPNNTDAPVNRMSITPAGNVGVGTTAPNELLTVAGNISATGVIITPDYIEITDPNKGIIIKSPDNTRWKIIVTDAGILSATNII